MRKETLLLTLNSFSNMDFLTTLVPGLKLDMWTIGLVFASIVAIPILYILYRRFTTTKEDLTAPSSDHFQVPQ